MSSKIVRNLIVASLLIGAPAVASAQEADENLFQRYGLALSVGGGVTGFTDGDTNDFMSDVGGAWEARVAFGTNSIIGVEAAYIGSALDMDTLGVEDDAVLLGNGLEADARLNIVRGPVRPFILAGIGWTRFDVTNTDVNTSDVADDDDVFHVPLGVGVDYRFQNLLLDARAIYRPAGNADLIADAADGEESRLDTWTVALRGGFEF